jgi:PAS domain S-box-containing protein
VIETFWPAGALAIAAAAWMDRGPAPRGAVSERSGATLTAVGIAIAVVALIGDHFSQIDTLTFILAALTLLGGIVQLGFLYRDRMQARMAVAAAKTLRSVSSDAALDCVVSIDADGKVCEWNDAARHTFGYRGEYAVGRDLAELIVPHEQQASHHAGLARWLTTGESRILNRRVEMMAVHAQGHRFPVELTITQVRVDPPMFTGFLRDISEAKRQGEENDRLAAIVRSSEDAIHSTDLDGLATAWNHGAELLYGYSTDEAVGKRLEDLIVPRDLADELKQMTKRVLDGEPAAVETKRLRKNGGVIDVSLRSFPIRDLGGGVTGASTSAYDITQRKRREEHDAKNAEGRLWRGRVEAALRDETFMFWGQPVVDVQTGAVHHHELLLRMDLDGDVITPNHFLPHAEDGELITEIDRWAIREGVAFAKKLPVAINLSARSLGNPGVIDQITSALGDRKLASRVIFEITETAAVANLDTARDVVEELVAIGCGVALDDFGTGYGSFTHIEQLPVTELKIDMSFVQGLARTPTDQRLVRSIIAIARNFDMKTVAEGVEDVNTLTLLRRLGVDYVQGYYVGYPAQMTSSGRWPAATQMSSSSIRQATEPLRPPDLRPEKRHEAPHRARRTHPID